MTHEQVIYGQPPSKSNQYRIITLHGHGSLAKTSAMKAYEKKFYLECGAYRNRNISGFFELYVDVYFQTCNAIKNDRNCVKIVANKFIDRVRPRIEFTIKEVGGVEKRDSKEPSFF